MSNEDHQEVAQLKSQVAALEQLLDTQEQLVRQQSLTLQEALVELGKRRRAENALRESEARFQAFMDHSPAVAFLKDEEGRHLYVNKPFATFYQLSEEQWLGKTDFDLWPAKVAAVLRHHDLRVMAEKRPLEVRETVPGPDGQDHHWLSFKFPVEDAFGRHLLGGMAVDVTEYRQLEEQLRQSQKMEAVGRLAGGIAHDFNNLLTIISGYSELLLTRVNPQEWLYSKIEQIKKAGDRAAALTHQLLAFSRRQVLMPKVLDLNEVVVHTGTMLQRLVGEDIHLVMALDQAAGRVIADAGQIEQVIMNLVVNARDAMPQGGRLIIETASVEIKDPLKQEVTPGRYVTLTVSDTGCGIDPAIRPQIFEPFFTTKEPGKGSGLGLSTVYGILKQSGGHICVYSEPGHGASFKVYLPRVEAEETRLVEGGMPPVGRTEGQETILLVEDEPDVRALMRDSLSSRGYTVLEARHGLEALLFTKQHDGPIHLLLTDVVMPQMSGRTVAERALSLRPALRVLYMSGYTENAIIFQDLLEPGIAFLQKPFSLETLARKVRELLDMPAA